MKVQRILSPETHNVTFELFDDEDQPIEIVSRFVRHLRARDYSPNTLSAYCFDLLHFMTFLKDQQLTYVVNALRSEQIWPANVEHCPQS
jgi:integrase family protein with SAM-like domain